MSSLNTNTVITNKVYEKTIKIFAKKNDISNLPSTITINVNSSIKLTMHVDITTSKPFYYIPISDVINYFKKAGTINETTNNVLFYKYYSSGSSSNSFTIVKNLNELLERITNSNYQLFFIKKSCFEISGSDHLINEISNITSLIEFSKVESFNTDDYILVHVNYDTIDHETNTSIMYDSHASGIMTNIYGRFSNTEGFETTVMGNKAHAEGDNTVAIGHYSHTKGKHTIADINNMTSIGSYNKPNYDVYVNAESNIYITDDNTTYTINKQEGSELFTATNNTTNRVITNLTKYASGDETLKDKIFVVGNGTSDNNRKDAFVITNDGNAIVQNDLSANSITTNKLTLNSYELNKVINDQNTMNTSTNLEKSLITANYVNVNKPGLITSANHSEIFNCYKNDDGTNTIKNIASGNYSHAEGSGTKAEGNNSHAEGSNTTASGKCSHAEGFNTIASNGFSHAEGYHTKASGSSSHAEGDNTTASGNYSHAEGNNTTASGDYSHTEGYYTKASGMYSHTEGYYTKASSSSSHAEGGSTTASGNRSHAEGSATTASGDYSHAGGYHTTANQTYQTVIGAYNTYNGSENNKIDKLFVVGNGTDNNNRSNAFIVDKDGNAIVQNNLTVNNNKIMSSDLNIYYFIKNSSDSSLLLNKDFTYVNITGGDINVNFFYVDEYGNRKYYAIPNNEEGWPMIVNKAYKISIVNGEITSEEVNLSNISKAIDIVTNNVYTYANSTWTIDNEQKFIVSKDNSTITSNALVSDTLYTNNISSNSMKPIVNYELTKITEYEEEDKVNILPDSKNYSVNCGNTIQIEKTYDTTINLKAYKRGSEGLYNYCKLETRNGMTLYNENNDRNTYINDDKITLSSEGNTERSKSLIELQQSENLVNAQINIYDNIDDKQYLSSMRANEFDTTDINAQNINTYTFKIEVPKYLHIRGGTSIISITYENGYYRYPNTANISSNINGTIYYWFYTKNDNKYTPLKTIDAIVQAKNNNTLIYFDENLLLYSNTNEENNQIGSRENDGTITYDGNFPSVIMIEASNNKVDFKIKPLDKIKCYCVFDRYDYSKLKDTTFYLTFKNDYYYIDIKDIVYTLHDNCTDFLTACTSLTTNNTTDNVLYNICNFDDILKHINHIYLYDKSVVNKAFLPFYNISSWTCLAKICVSKSSLNTNVDNNYLTIQSFTDIEKNTITKPSTDPSTNPSISYDIITQSYSSSLLTDKDLNVQTINTSDIIIRKYKVKSLISSGKTPIDIECEYGYSYQKIKLVLKYNKNDKYYYFDTKDILNYMNYITSITPTNYLLFYKESNTYKTITNFQLLNAHIDSLYLNANCITTSDYGMYLGIIDSNYCQIEINDLFVLSNANNSITLSSIILTNGNTSIKLYIDENNELAVKNVNATSTTTMSLYGTIKLK